MNVLPPPPPRYKRLARGVRDLLSGIDIEPDLSSRAWIDYQRWLAAGNVPQPPDVTLPTPEEIAAEAELQAQRDTAQTLRADAALRALRNRTPAEVDAWIDANVTTLAEARAVLKILARVVALIARERFGNGD